MQISLLPSSRRVMLWDHRTEQMVTVPAAWHKRIVRLVRFWGAMTVALPSSPPEQGQMVSVRSRNWMATDVERPLGA